MPENVYLTILGSELDFVYTIKAMINSFQHRNQPIVANTIFPADDCQIAFLTFDRDSRGNNVQLSDEIIETLKAPGNLVFIHPDSAMTTATGL